MMSYLLIIRPLNLFITAVSSAAAYFIVAPDPDHRILFLIIMSTVLTAGAGNIINDIIDIDIDIINKPERPLPSKSLKVSSAYFLYLVLAGASLSAGFLLGYHSFAAVVLVNIILLSYTVFLKRRPFWGNFVVAFLGGYLFYFCSITTGNFEKILPLSVSAFLFHFIREIIKDIADIRGDKHRKANTMAIKLGVCRTVSHVKLLLTTLVFYLVSLMVSGGYNLYFSLIILFSVFPVIIYIMRSLFKEPSEVNFERLSLIMKTDMIFGILAFYFGMI